MTIVPLALGGGAEGSTGRLVVAKAMLRARLAAAAVSGEIADTVGGAVATAALLAAAMVDL